MIDISSCFFVDNMNYQNFEKFYLHLLKLEYYKFYQQEENKYLSHLMVLNSGPF